MLTKLFSRFTSDLNSISTPTPPYYSNWQTAENQCDGYAAPAILESIVSATRTVSRGDALYDCDGVAYRNFEENTHLVAALRHVLTSEGRFEVLDYGGSLGSLYRQHRWFLSEYSDFNWCVVEQQPFVETGKRLFENKKLKFEASISDACTLFQPNIAVISNALHRQERPFEVLDKIAQLDIPYLFIDQMPIINATESRITQSVFPARHCNASYPSWLFGETIVKEKLQQYYRILNEFDAQNAKFPSNGTRHLGFFCEKY
jgi:putative methyltransferase (TIGR04325 family)